MKPDEFKDIEANFKREQTRWEALKIGDSVFTTVPYGGVELDIFQYEITYIDTEERKVMGVFVHREDSIPEELTRFYTEPEIKEYAKELGLELDIK